MDAAVIIPARYASSRLPGKPLLRATGKYLIQHVYERAAAAKVGPVIVATDDQRIVEAVRGFGGQVAWTRADHKSGTDRVAEVAENLGQPLVVNVQGDEPQLEPGAIRLLVDLLKRDAGAVMATLATPIRDRANWLDPNCVKVVCDAAGRALYFSRSPIPFVRDAEPDFQHEPAQFLQHLGLYAYRRDFLLQLALLPPHPLEEAEKLEQLRVLGLGRSIQVGRVEQAHRGVDTPADYERFVRTCRAA